MDINGRPDHIEDYLVSLHTGQWFGWSDVKNKVYANLIIHDDSKSKPSVSTTKRDTNSTGIFLLPGLGQFNKPPTSSRR